MRLTVGSHELEPVYAILIVHEGLSLQAKTADEIFKLMKETHPNERHALRLIEANFDIPIPTFISISALIREHQVDGFMIKLKGANIVYNKYDNAPFSVPAGYSLESTNLWE